MKRPRLYRMDFTLIGLTAIQAYDGKAGWTVTPFSGDPNAHPMTPEEEADMAPRVEFDTLLLDYKARGTGVELLGTEDVNGAPAYKLKVKPKVGSERYVYLDRKTYLEVKREELRQGGKEIIEGVVGDYRKVGGLTLPHSFESGPKGGPKAATLKIETIELDPQIDDARFQKPDTKLPVAPPIPAGHGAGSHTAGGARDAARRARRHAGRARGPADPGPLSGRLAEPVTVAFAVTDPAPNEMISAGTGRLLAAAFLATVAIHTAEAQVCDPRPAVLTTVDGPGPLLGFRVSMATGADGFPVISYDEQFTMKVVKCGDAGCTGGNVVTTVAPGGCGL